MAGGHTAYDDHESVTYVSDSDTGLEAVIAIHDTTLGPALGGTRIRDYDSLAAATQDALQLSRAMTSKAAAADLDLGGGKAVINMDPAEKTDNLLRSYGTAVDALNGRYITAEDMNTTVADMELIREETDHVVGTADGTGDPSKNTAWGVLQGQKGALRHLHGSGFFTGDDVHVAVQGVGKVGSELVTLLYHRDAEITVADPNEDRVEQLVGEYGVNVVDPDEIYDVDCDIFAPCAAGGVINDETVERLQCDIVAGSANNQLETRADAERLQDQNILYVPDYVLNAGGLIDVARELTGGTRAAAREQAKDLQNTLDDIYDRAVEEDCTTVEAADAFVEDRLAAAQD